MGSKRKNRPDNDHDNEIDIIESNNLLQSVIDASLTGIGYLKPIRNDSEKIVDFLCVFANKKAVEIAGETEMSGKQYCELFPGISETAVFKYYIKAFEENVLQDFETYYNIGEFNNWFRVTAVKVGDGIVVSFEDITRQKIAEKGLAAQNNLLKQSEELAKSGSWEYDINTKDFFLSDGMYRLFDMKKGTHVVPAIYLDYTTEQDVRVAQKIVEAIENKFHSFEETLRIKSNGTVKTLKIKAAPLKNGNGQIEKMLGVDVDITAIQQSEEKILELNKSLSFINKELRSLNAELKNLNSITANNYSEALRQVYIHLEAIVTNDARTLSDSSRANLRRAQSAIQKMKLLSNDITNYLQLYDIGINKELINPNSIIESILSGMKGKIEDANATINTTILPPFAADPLLFSRLITNLIDNAIKFRKLVVDPIIKIHHSGAEELNAMPKAVNNTRYIIITISDNGIGFQQEEMDKMFELFHQLPDHGKYKGSGMGLAICKKIMEMHGGFIEAEGQPSRGASLHCYFPV
ncbi:MAG TPA: ATP-binding protein [Chitinophagaceae bacterium]|nr:ATP-binding protein [Chitinophagaceae bacterium]